MYKHITAANPQTFIKIHSELLLEEIMLWYKKDQHQ